MKKNRLILLVSLFLLFLIFYSRSSPLYSGKKPKDGKLNLLLITIDTLRADRLSCYSEKHLQTPNMDSLAERGILFSRAFANTSTTLPSHTNILLGTSPLYHGVHENSSFIVREEFLTLAELLKSHDYSTGAFVSSYILDSRFGLSQGFDNYDDDCGRQFFQRLSAVERPAEAAVDEAVQWLGGQKSPWFLWLHCFDPHDPYEPPEPYRTQYQKSLYDGEVAYVDFVLGRLFNYLKEKDLFEKTLIVFTGDHGESLGEHGELTHGFFAYNTTIWVPLIICVPGLKLTQVDQYVSHIDIFPTVCDILDVKKPPFLQGSSLLPALRGKKLKERPIYFESLYPYYSRGWAPLRGFIYEQKKYIESPIPELYAMDKDFEEVDNLADKEKLDKYKSQLERMINEQSLPDKGETRQRIDRESLEKLKSLGYISSGIDARKESFDPGNDVKTMLPYANKANQGMGLYQKGRAWEGMELLKEIITERKDIDIAYYNLANIYEEQGRLTDSLEVLRLGVENIPESYEIFFQYVYLLVRTGQYEEMDRVLKEGDYRQIEYDPEIWNIVGIAYTNKGNFEKAIQIFEKALAIDSEDAVLFNSLGNAYYSFSLKTKNPEFLQKSIQSYKKSIEINPEYPTPYNGLGMAYRQAGKMDESIRHCKKALELRPDFAQALYNLGLAYLDKNNKTEALACFNKYKEMFFARLSPHEREELETLINNCK
jgi:arylsulfatase A-like enzyme/Flp pilus assembly protein TadD